MLDGLGKKAKLWLLYLSNESAWLLKEAANNAVLKAHLGENKAKQTENQQEAERRFKCLRCVR